MDDFHKVSTLILEEIAGFFESSWPEADVDLFEDAVTVSLFTGQQYVINKHGVTRQIWVSSPFTGAHHFQWEEGQWRCTRTGAVLQEFLMNERNAYAT